MTHTRHHTKEGRSLCHATALAAAALCFLALSCSDELHTYAPQGGADGNGTTYWHTRTRTPGEQQTMLRNHGVGFSFDAINGEKCDAGSVRCQVVDLATLEADGAYDCDYVGHSEMTTSCSRSFAEYCHNVNTGTSVSGGVLIYKGSYMKTASIFEHAFDNSICFTAEMSERAVEKFIDTNIMDNLLKEEPERYLSDNFLYAIDKLRRAGTDNVAVVDSFIEIFGTHVITDASVGGKLKLDVVTGQKTVSTLVQEQQIKEQSLNLFFKKKVETMTESELKAATMLLSNAELHLDATGGDLSPFSTLIANPSTDNPAATPETLENWLASINFDETHPWDSRCEMLDMEVTPIWEFIPDPTVAALVESRIKATAPTMQELYGNRNFVNVEIPAQPGTVTTGFNGRPMTVTDPWVVDVIAANRHVATVCKEWVPEIDPNSSVRVVYPIYDNRLQMDAGLCIHNGVPYRVKWLYDRFEVEKTDTVVDGNTVYLTFGYLDYAKTDGADYLPGSLRIGYEWPGSIATDGSVANKEEICTTRKFLGNFYTDNDKRHDNLPNWTYTTADMSNKHYTETYAELFATDEPYRLSGVKLDGRSGSANITGRMVRNQDYVYYINTTEIPQ